MKKIILLCFALLGIVLSLPAQFNDQLGINYQAVARDAAGNLITGKVIYLQTSLRVGGADGKEVYSEVHEATTGKTGLFQLVIGKGQTLSGEYGQVPWAEKNIWLAVAMSEGKGREFVPMGASQLLAVPYAYHAGSAETIHLHEEFEGDEKRRCSSRGIPFWTTQGNAYVTDDCHFIGTVVDEDLIFKANNVERLRITADGQLNAIGEFNIDGPLNVTGIANFAEINIEGDLAVGGNGSFAQDVEVAHNLSSDSLAVVSHVEVDGTTTIKGQLEANGRLVVAGGADGSQSDQDSYPLLVKGSKQGIAIEVNPAAANNWESGRGNNYMSFWKDGQMTGRIEGMNTADLDPTGLISLITTLISNPPSGVSYNFGSLSLRSPSVDVDKTTGSILDLGLFLKDVLVDVSFGNVSVSNPFGSIAENLKDYIRDPTGGPAKLIFDQFTSIACDPETGLFTQAVGEEAATNFKSQIFSNYTLDILTNSIATFGSFAELAVSAASVLDPEDIVNEAIDVVVDITNLVIIGSYADINRGVAYESGSGDYAEWLHKADELEVLRNGDVVGVIGGRISKKFTHAERFMVVSTAPIVLGNMPKDPDQQTNMEKIAFMGQVPVRVMGAVNIGDYLLPSGRGDGLAIAVAPDKMKARDYQRIIGVAWETSDGSEFIKMINTAVGINQNDTGRLIEQMQSVINNMQSALQQVNPDYQPEYFELEDLPAAQTYAQGITLSPTHPAQVAALFDGEKKYQNRTEALQDVKRVLTENANINLEQYPMVAYILDHPEEAAALSVYYKQLQGLFGELVASKN